MQSDTVTLRLDDSNSVVIHKFGATVISWISDDQEILFVSSKAVFDNKKAIRGGIPVVFPNFGPWSLGPQHGFARISLWKLESQDETGGDSVTATLTLSSSEATKAMWNYEFALTYQVTLSRTSGLTCALHVNNNDKSPFDFTTLLHTYIRVDDVEKATVSNLSGLQYNDKLKGGEEFTESKELVSVVNGADSVYKSTPDHHEIVACVNGSKVIITKQNLPDTVLWNPWVENAKKMSDFGDEEFKEMICVEPGAVSERIVLAAGGTATFSQTVRVVKQ